MQLESGIQISDIFLASWCYSERGVFSKFESNDVKPTVSDSMEQISDA